MADVFVSYAREDVAKAKVIARELEAASYDVWVDERIHSGSEFSREIEAALAGACAVVVLWSKHSINSAWVRDEAAEGRDSGRLVPVLLDDSRPPIGFRQFQATDLSHWSGRGRPRQIDEIISAVGSKTHAPPVGSSSKTAAPARWTRIIPWSAAALAVVAAAVIIFLFAGHARETPGSAPSIALLPFKTASADPQERELASAARATLAHMLSSTEFRVGLADRSPDERRRDSDFVLSADVSSSPEKMVVNVRVTDTAHDVLVYSQPFEANRANASDLPDQIGAQIAGSLGWTASLLMLERNRQSDPAIMGELFGRGGDFQTARQIAARAPNSAIGQIALAFGAANAIFDLPRAQRVEAAAIGRSAAERVRVLAPAFGGNEILWCALHNRVRKIECEDHLRAGMRYDPDSPWVEKVLADLLKDVGRVDEAQKLASDSMGHDPYVSEKIGLALRMLEATGRHTEAEELYGQAQRWWPGDPVIFADRLYGIFVRGDFQALARFAKKRPANVALVYDPLAAVLAAIEAKDVGQMRALCPIGLAPSTKRDICMLGFARLGDSDDAFALASGTYPNRVGRTTADEDSIWLESSRFGDTDILTGPVAAPFRRDARYLELARRLGLLNYWRSGRLPDFCQPPNPEPVCGQLRRTG
jgi:TolB-like protein